MIELRTRAFTIQAESLTDAVRQYIAQRTLWPDFADLVIESLGPADQADSPPALLAGGLLIAQVDVLVEMICDEIRCNLCLYDQNGQVDTARILRSTKRHITRAILRYTATTV